MSTEHADMLVLQEIKRCFAALAPGSIIPVTAWAEQIHRDISGSAFSMNEIVDEIVMMAAELGAPVEFGTKS